MTFQISAARPDERGAALNLFFQHLAGGERAARVDRALTMIGRGEFPADGLLVLRSGSALLGAIAALPVEGAAALVWPPQTVARADRERLEDQLIAAANTWLIHRGAKFAQALLTDLDAASAASLCRNGFKHITTLRYLHKDLETLHDEEHGTTTIYCQTYAEVLQSHFHDILLATYNETLDCPELNGLRTVDDIIAGYRAVPGCRLDRWWLASRQELPAGVLITAASEDGSTWELLYLGLVPTARRLGLGKELTRKALWEAHAAGAARLALTVDGRNIPALRLYGSLGFEEYDRREVYLRVFGLESNRS